MAGATQSFTPTGNLKALFEQLYSVKFSKHVPLSVVMLSGIYAVYRSQHYLSTAFHLDRWVAVPTSVFIEALVLASGAAVFIACREKYVAELKEEDTTLASVGVYLTLTLIAFAFVTLLGIAWADAWNVTNDPLGSAIMTLAQATQAGLIGSFIVSALLDERAKLRTDLATFKQEQRAQQASACQHCGRQQALNNLRRHERACPLNPNRV